MYLCAHIDTSLFVCVCLYECVYINLSVYLYVRQMVSPGCVSVEVRVYALLSACQATGLNNQRLKFVSGAGELNKRLSINE